MNKFRFNWKKAILISFLLVSFSSATNAELPTTIIKSCYDGDTCTTIDGEKIRLACIDTPELKGKKSEPIKAREARDFLNDLLINEKVSIKRITKDRYGKEERQETIWFVNFNDKLCLRIQKNNVLSSKNIKKIISIIKQREVEYPDKLVFRSPFMYRIGLWKVDYSKKENPEL